MRVRVVAFARVREILGETPSETEVPDGANAGDVWLSFVERFPELDALSRSTRLARNGLLVGNHEALEDGDEVAFLPPVGGG